MRPGPANTSTPPRCSGLALTATTLVALVAMTATVAGAPSPGRPEAHGRSAETLVVRAVAAAVAAVARDLAHSERSTLAAARLVPAFAWRLELAAGAPPRETPGAAPANALLDERLLDRPPPRA